jgi:hypothetical protein
LRLNNNFKYHPGDYTVKQLKKTPALNMYEVDVYVRPP